MIIDGHFRKFDVRPILENFVPQYDSFIQPIGYVVIPSTGTLSSYSLLY